MMSKEEMKEEAKQNIKKIVYAQIDRLVYELYGLTEEEIKVVKVLCQ